MSDLRSDPSAVAKVCRARELLSEASDLLISARLDSVAYSNSGGGEFRGADLDRRLDAFAGKLTDDFYALNPIIRELAELIPTTEGETNV